MWGKTNKSIDVPRPLINDLWIFLFLMIDAECVKCASRAGTLVNVKAKKQQQKNNNKKCHKHVTNAPKGNGLA